MKNKPTDIQIQIKRKATLTQIKLTKKISVMSCPSASSRAHVTLIQSFLFNFKSLRLQESALSSLEIPRSSPLSSFCLFISPFYLLCHFSLSASHFLSL